VKIFPSPAATCNAVSALYKIIQFQSNVECVGKQKDKLLQFWLSSLPVSGDFIEAKIVHQNLVTLIEQNDSVIINKQNIPKLIKIFSDVLNTDKVNEKTQEKIINVLKEFQNVLPRDYLQQIFNNLTDEERNNLLKSVNNKK